jgi:site-specific recombinase XerD
MILDDYKTYLLARKQSTNYYNIIKLWLAYLEKNNIDYKEITQEIITKFFTDKSYYANESRNQFIKAANNFYEQFLQVPKEKNEWRKLKRYKRLKREPKFISLEELNDIVTRICNYENRLMPPIKAEALINFMYYTGLRKEELLTLKRCDINFEDNPCRIRVVGKGDKERFVYFSEKYSPSLKKKLSNYFSYEPENNNAFNLTLGKINYLIRKINHYMGEKKISAHSFRHSFGKYLLDKGVPLTYIQALYGHSSIQTTMIYLNPTQGMIEKTFKDDEKNKE